MATERDYSLIHPRPPILFAVMDTQAKKSPWASGPGEILRHGLELLRTDTDTNRRLAMISIDNAVELMMKTFLGLPRRISGLNISRKQYQEISESFTALLDALEQHASERLEGVDLGTIEWYHRLRNELYHQGNGLTVERDKVEIYAELANILFNNLFGIKLVEPPTSKAGLLGEFMTLWAIFERAARLRSLQHEPVKSERRPRLGLEAVEILRRAGELTDAEVSEIREFRDVRNRAAHAEPGWESQLTAEKLKRLERLARKFPSPPPAG